MHFDARSRTHDPRMRVRVNVIGAIHPNAAPRRAIEIDGVRAPHKKGCAHPNEKNPPVIITAGPQRIAAPIKNPGPGGPNTTNGS
jgi:hypothetical protein